MYPSTPGHLLLMYAALINNSHQISKSKYKSEPIVYEIKSTPSKRNAKQNGTRHASYTTTNSNNPHTFSTQKFNEFTITACHKKNSLTYTQNPAAILYWSAFRPKQTLETGNSSDSHHFMPQSERVASCFVQFTHKRDAPRTSPASNQTQFSCGGWASHEGIEEHQEES